MTDSPPASSSGVGRSVSPTIADLKALQRRLNLLGVHVVWIGSKRFVIAHTDEERAGTISLEECELHEWLSDCYRPPQGVGYYVAVPHEARFDFTPLEYFDFTPPQEKSR